MAKDDILPWDHPMGQLARVLRAPLNAGETFTRGEPVKLNSDGELQESDDDPTSAQFAGVCASNGDTVGTSNTIDAFRKTFASATRQTTMQTGDLVEYWLATPGTVWVARNFGTTSEQFDQDLAVANIGDEAGLELVSGTWGLNTGATNNIARIVDVISSESDGNYSLTERSDLTVGGVVFLVVQSQATESSAPA